MSITLQAAAGRDDAYLQVNGVPPYPVPCDVWIDSEQIRVNEGSATIWGPCDRGINGTGRSSHANGSTVTGVYGTVQSGVPSNPNPVLDFSSLTPGNGTAGSVMTTGTTWVPFTTAGACGGKLLLENQSATGEFATWRMRARCAFATASGDGGNSVGTTTCIDASASANHADYGVLKAINAVAQPNAFNQTTDATNIVTALYGRIDATGTSVGRRWVTWIDTHATTKAAGGDFMMRISHNGTAAIDGAITIYGGGRLPVLFNFEDATPGFLDLAAKTITFKATDGNHTISFT